MTDLEIKKLCAEAMGYQYFLVPKLFVSFPGDSAVYLGGHESDLTVYEPMENDAQAMELVKRFHLEIVMVDKWCVSYGAQEVSHTKSLQHNLNRAICECVAKMHSAQLSTRTVSS